MFKTKIRMEAPLADSRVNSVNITPTGPTDRRPDHESEIILALPLAVDDGGRLESAAHSGR